MCGFGTKLEKTDSCVVGKNKSRYGRLYSGINKASLPQFNRIHRLRVTRPICEVA